MAEDKIADLQRRLDEKLINPNDLSPQQREALNIAFEEGTLKGYRSVSDMVQERRLARKDIAEDVRKRLEPLAPTSLLSLGIRRGTLAAAGDIVGSFTPYIMDGKKLSAEAREAALAGKSVSYIPKIKDKIISTAKDAGTPGFDHYYGYGILDVKAALGINDPIIDNSISESQVSSSLISTSEFNSVDLSSSHPTTSLTSDSSIPNSQPEEIKTWTVTFKVIKSIYRQEMVEDGQRVIMPPNPSIRFLRTNSKMAIVFVGWTTESGQVYDFSTPVTYDVVLIAKFKMVRIVLRTS